MQQLGSWLGHFHSHTDGEISGEYYGGQGGSAHGRAWAGTDGHDWNNRHRQHAQVEVDRSPATKTKYCTQSGLGHFHTRVGRTPCVWLVYTGM